MYERFPRRTSSKRRFFQALGGSIPLLLAGCTSSLGTTSMDSDGTPIDATGEVGEPGSQTENPSGSPLPVTGAGGSGSEGLPTDVATQPEDPTLDPASQVCQTPQASQAELRFITAREYDNAVRTLLGSPDTEELTLITDTTSGPFNTNRGAAVSSLAAGRYHTAAELVAAEAMTRLDDLLPCGGDIEEACALEFLNDIARRAYRRPLTDEQQEALAEGYRWGVDEQGEEYAIQGVLEHVFQSPYFLYHVERSEPGSGPNGLERLTGYSVADKLAAFLWESIPDDELLAAAESGELSTPEGILAQSERMMEDPQSVDAFVSFFTQWFGLDEIERVQKDPDLFPQFDDNMAAAMRRETEEFVRWMIRTDNFNLTELLTSTKAFPGEDLAEFYGVEPVANDEPVDLDPSRRFGIMTHPSILASRSHATKSSIVIRGVFVRDRLLCQPLPDPPPDVDFDLPQVEEGTDMSARDVLALHRSQPSCNTCHSLIDDLGFAFENFDAIGAYRTEEAGLDIDATGSLTGTSEDGAFTDVAGLIERIQNSDQGLGCAVSQWTRFAQRRLETSQEVCTLQAGVEALRGSDFDFRSLIAATVQSDAFRFRDPAFQL